MLKINTEGLKPEEKAMLDALLAAIQTLPEKVRFDTIKNLPFLDERLEFNDESILDMVDRIVLQRENQVKLLELHDEYLRAMAERQKHNTFSLNLDDEGVDLSEDHLHRPIAKVVIKLWEHPEYLDAYEWAENAKMRLWATWSKIIPDEHKNIIRRAGGIDYRLPALQRVNGTIRCQR